MIDEWGRVHYLRDETIVGRMPAIGIAVLERSISREHAKLGHSDGLWQVCDLNSRNGTRVAETLVAAATSLASGQIISFGNVSFYFLARLELMCVVPIKIETADQSRAQHQQEPSEPMLTLAAPSGDVGGIAELGGATARLTPIQFAFMELLAERILAEVDQPSLVRGYVRSSELLVKLPWDTPTPIANNVKQLVRRVRSILSSAGLGDIIESRHRFGYRLRVIPKPYE